MVKKFGPRRGVKGLNVYSNLSAARRSRKDSHSRRKAEYMASLPKHPLKRVLYRLHPKRFFAYWFSREGGIMALKIAGVGALVMVVMVGALFAFFRRELDAIRPGEISKRVQTTVTTYYDRNGVVLWEDKGDGDYKLVVENDKISKYMKSATVAIEDKNFFNHSGVSPTGILRAAVNNFSGGSTQGGSTLTQQLVKNVFFEDEAQDRGLGGIPRKIKEVILAIEVERMYNKDQILSLYLNEVPYGGRRNGVESAAQTYFGKPAKDLTLAESALLAGIPQQPGLYDPYNEDGHEALLARQKIVLDKMVEERFVTKQEADEAKKVAILDTVRPQSETYGDIKAPHFVKTVQAQLEEELGVATVGRGGLTVKTTLDYRVQEVIEKAITDLFNSNVPKSANFDNSAVTIVDVQTGQILGMMGSRNYSHPGYGTFNTASDAYLQPGSSIKPMVIASLFKPQQNNTNYGPGSVLKDENINNVVGYELNNFDNKFRGDLTVRQGLAESRNIPLVKAYFIDGREDVLNTIHSMGDTSYCTQGVDKTAGPSLAIGGCTLKQVEHVNSFATFARGGVYKKESYMLEVKNPQGQVIKQWKDEGKQVMDPQIPYLISDILSDENARAPSFGRGAAGLNVPGVKTATKTGTSNIGKDSRDLWMMSYTPKVAMGIWVGNHDSQPLRDALSSRVGPTVNKIMGPVHTDIFAKDGTWKAGDWFTQPAGIQKITVNGRTDIFPSWFNKSQQNNGTKVTFDTVSKKKATQCTPARAKSELTVTTISDPVTRRQTTMAPDGYDASKEDDVHKCDDVKPFVSRIEVNRSGDTYTLTASVNQGTHALQSVEFRVGGQVVGTVPAPQAGEYTVEYTPTANGNQEVVVTVIDQALYDSSDRRTLDFRLSTLNHPGNSNGRGDN
ncbi:hypothetical protein CYG49_00925 [Candidatus Saccharibacteria bacterium]|nr:MAG: hypothetical protein CYG49_00925 [Candidatus Saccharibacteria bacterium]